MLVQSQAELRLILAELFGVGNRYETVHVRLYQNDLTPDGSSALGDLTEADFDGYADVGPEVWGATFTNPEGSAEKVGSVAQFTQTGVVITNTVYGYYLTNAAGNTLYGIERFEAPVLMDTANKAIAVVPRYLLGQP